MEKWIKRAIELGAGLFFTGKSNPSVVPYYPQKTVLPGVEAPYFHRSFPERHGVSSGRLLAMLTALEKERRANVHSIIVVKDGEAICSASHPGYSVNLWHLSHSMSKTVTGLAVGMLVDDGLLSTDMRLAEIFPEYHYVDKRVGSITVRQLLTMTTGVKFSEAGSVSESRWSEAFFASALAFTPGTAFNYNSMNSYMLARIVVKLTGRSLTDFLRERLFAPLGIDSFFWEIGPEGVEKGGWGLYMSAESWAKLGYLFLKKGTFEGRRIISEEWIVRSTTDVVRTPDALGHYGYGYQLWASDDGESYLFNGMLGQNVWVCPKNDLVVALNSGNNELFQNSPALAIIERYLAIDLTDDLTESCFAGDLTDLARAEKRFFESRHWVRPSKPARRFGLRIGGRTKEYIPAPWEELLGKYHFIKNNYGMLPLIVRGMQNNLKSSVDGIAFERDGDRLFFVYTECGRNYRLEVGFSDFKESVLEVRGEKYIVKVIGEAMEDEDRNMLYKLELLFPELPNTRMLKISFGDEGRLILRMSELPNHRIADRFVTEMHSMNPKLGFVKDLLERKIGKHFVTIKLEECFAPGLVGARIGSENYAAIMDEEREKLRAGERTVRVIDTVVDKFLRDEDDEDDEGESRSGFREFFGDIVERFKTRYVPQRAQALPPEVPPALPAADDES